MTIFRKIQAPGFIFSDVMMNMVGALVKQGHRECGAPKATNPGLGKRSINALMFGFQAGN
jgi:hypothetical protein